MIAIEDMGLLSYMTENFGSKTNNITAIKNFVYNEIIKNLAENYKCFTYQKINNSAIDFIIRDTEGMLIPIVISESSSDKAPKIFKSFEVACWKTFAFVVVITHAAYATCIAVGVVSVVE